MSDSDRNGVALLAREAAPPWDLLAPPFPIVRRGYDRDTVDERIAELERELEELRSGQASVDAVSAEIARIGEQTAAILTVAHEQAAETTRRAQAEADRCLSAAAANAVKMTEDAKQQLRQLDGETDAVWRERARLLEDVRGIATSLFNLAEEALERFPPEAERTVAPPASEVESTQAFTPVAATLAPEDPSPTVEAELPPEVPEE